MRRKALEHLGAEGWTAMPGSPRQSIEIRSSSGFREYQANQNE